MIVIGLDIGTTSICGLAFDLSSGRVVRSVSRPNDSFLSGAMQETAQDPEQIIRTVKDILDGLLRQYPDAAGIGVSGQMHGILYTDGEGRAVSPLYTWQDRRGLLPSEDGDPVASRLSRITGCPVYTGYGFVTHAVLCGNGGIPKQASALCTIADYAVMRLTGRRVPAMDASNAASIGFFDVERGRFDNEALRIAGIASDWVPQVVLSKGKAGEYAGRIPVFQAIGDNQASVLGSLHDLRSSVLLNIGTGGQLSLYSEQYISVNGLETRPFPGGGYLLVGASLAGGKAYAMLERFFRSVVEAFAGPEYAVAELYGKMEQWLSDHRPSGEKLSVRTQFFGTREEPERRAAIERIGPANWTTEHLILGVLEGMAEELYGFFAALPDAIKGNIRTLVGSGNGLRKNKHLRSVCAEQFGMQLQLPSCEEEAAVGAALHAAVGAGLAKDHAAAGRLMSGYGR